MNTELAYITKDQSLIRELLHPDALPGLGMSLIMVHTTTRFFVCLLLRLYARAHYFV